MITLKIDSGQYRDNVLNKNTFEQVYALLLVQSSNVNFLSMIIQKTFAYKSALNSSS